jgi:hypothetical protein
MMDEVQKRQIDCSGLTKDEINRDIITETDHLFKTSLLLKKYDYDTLESIIIPERVVIFNCIRNKIKSCFAAFGSTD